MEPNSQVKKAPSRLAAYKSQELVYGALSDKVREKIDELIKIYDPINKTLVKSESGKTATGRDARLPIPGTLIMKTYKGQKISVIFRI